MTDEQQPISLQASEKTPFSEVIIPGSIREVVEELADPSIPALTDTNQRWSLGHVDVMLLSRGVPASSYDSVKDIVYDRLLDDTTFNDFKRWYGKNVGHPKALDKQHLAMYGRDIEEFMRRNKIVTDKDGLQGMISAIAENDSIPKQETVRVEGVEMPKSIADTMIRTVDIKTGSLTRKNNPKELSRVDIHLISAGVGGEEYDSLKTGMLKRMDTKMGDWNTFRLWYRQNVRGEPPHGQWTDPSVVLYLDRYLRTVAPADMRARVQPYKLLAAEAAARVKTAPQDASPGLRLLGQHHEHFVSQDAAKMRDRLNTARKDFYDWTYTRGPQKDMIPWVSVSSAIRNLDVESIPLARISGISNGQLTGEQFVGETIRLLNEIDTKTAGTDQEGVKRAALSLKRLVTEALGKTTGGTVFPDTQTTRLGTSVSQDMLADMKSKGVITEEIDPGSTYILESYGFSTGDPEVDAKLGLPQVRVKKADSEQDHQKKVTLDDLPVVASVTSSWPLPKKS